MYFSEDVTSLIDLIDDSDAMLRENRPLLRVPLRAQHAHPGVPSA